MHCIQCQTRTVVVPCSAAVELIKRKQNAVDAACFSKPQVRSHEGFRSARRAEIKYKNLSEMTYNALNGSCKGWH